MGLNVIFDPLISVPLLMGIGVLTGLIVLFIYARTAGGLRRFLRIGLTLMRISVLGALLILLLRPMALKPRDEVYDRPALSVLVDTSQSMNTKDVGSRTRYEAALAALQDKKDSFQVFFACISEGITKIWGPVAWSRNKPFDLRIWG